MTERRPATKRSFDVAFLMTPDAPPPSSSLNTSSVSSSLIRKKGFKSAFSSYESSPSSPSTLHHRFGITPTDEKTPDSITIGDQIKGKPISPSEWLNFSYLHSPLLRADLLPDPPGIPSSPTDSLRKILEASRDEHQQKQKEQHSSPSIFSPISGAASSVTSTPTSSSEESSSSSPNLPPSITSALSFFAASSYSNTCAVCRITFRMTSDLVYHMRTHHQKQSSRNEDSYEKRRATCRLKCGVCGEHFRERHHLTRHMTSHEDRRSVYSRETPDEVDEIKSKKAKRKL